MGNNHEKFFSKNKRKILLLGLTDAGKTTFAQTLQQKPTLKSQASTKLDLQITDIKINKFTLCLFDLGGADRQRIFWRQNFFGTQGIIYFIDAQNQTEEIKFSLNELEKVVHDLSLEDIPIAVFVNNALSEKDSIANNIVQINKALVNMKVYGSQVEEKNSKKQLCQFEGSCKDYHQILNCVNWLLKLMKPL